MKTQDVRRYVNVELPRIAAKLGLSEWNFVLFFQPAPKVDDGGFVNQADFSMQPDYLSAKITFYPSTFESKAEIRKVIIHELIHVLQSDWHKFGEQVDAAIKGNDQLLNTFQTLWRSASEMNRYTIEKMLNSLGIEL